MKISKEIKVVIDISVDDYNNERCDLFDCPHAYGDYCSLYGLWDEKLLLEEDDNCSAERLPQCKHEFGMGEIKK